VDMGIQRFSLKHWKIKTILAILVMVCVCERRAMLLMLNHYSQKGSTK